MTDGAPKRRSWLGIRWRQFRNAPRPVFRAVASSFVIAALFGAGYLANDVALAGQSGADADARRLGAAVICALGVLVAGAFFTWLLVPLPRGSGTRATRTPWSAALGLFAAIPMVYFMFLLISIIRPLFG
ncbi:MAG TPA: hypothetical protein VJ850_05725 [Candidatus Limnocylindrales bacterium]|nr:hypothetical protein [Candidatus Limnocylindrales bacterium]